MTGAGGGDSACRCVGAVGCVGGIVGGVASSVLPSWGRFLAERRFELLRGMVCLLVIASGEVYDLD